MSTEPAPRVLNDFTGAWHLDRTVAHADGTQATFTGTAVWTPDVAGLAYHEQGQLQMSQGPSLRAERHYMWGKELDVFFSDGRFFHRVPALGGEAEHWCEPDTYKVSYDFSQWPRFTAVWKVSGPKKSYRMHSIYRPA